ncbi:unnamed protein product [Bursaphelenchus xylophilus]|uniref:(pine wood nematode) hypothetical protein n=1 Tax=Bursaphelenchus xylophilus TaxID=6326 RepID=A0A1I7RSM3_BURXY|nr:unnamed protein product [Bursaphelenchus xylophilus]CAG9122870.1 unnamed protein product [Bursaphelenchus xylophilus]
MDRPWVILFTFLTVANSLDLARKSCPEHFLHGKTESGVYALGDGYHTSFKVLCKMPSNAEGDSEVTTVIRTALERWVSVGFEPQTVGFQISDRSFLKHLIEPSDKCEQKLWIRWPAFNGNLSETYSFTLRSIQGIDKTIQWNGTKDAYEQHLTLSNTHAGVLHIIPDGLPNNFTAAIQIKTSSLEFREVLWPREHKCKFDLNSLSDRVRLLVTGSRKLSFSFRTDRPNERLLSFESADGNLEVQLVDGYLIRVGQDVYPISLLADTNWHTFTWDPRALAFHIDYNDPINVGLTVNAIQLTLNGQVGAFRRDSSEWMCHGAPELELKLVQSSTRTLCSENQPGFCYCKGPQSALINLKNRRVDCPAKTEVEKAFTLYRDSRKLSLFYLPSYTTVQPISVLIKTDSNVGLIFFGQHNRTGYGLERFQVQFEGERMTAGACSKLRRPDQICLSCAIKRKGGFATNTWMRVSLFYHQSNVYLTVDEQICQLTEDERKMDVADLYSMSSAVNSVLFLGGGTAYAKRLYLNEELINVSFRSKFFENTREKAPPLRGCVADLRVGGSSMDLHDIYTSQQITIVNDTKKQRDIFSITPKCIECEGLKSNCHGARCRIPQPIILNSFRKNADPVCDCAQVFADKNTLNGECKVESKQQTTTKKTSLALSRSEGPVHLEIRPGFLKYAKLQKLWALLRFPQGSAGLVSILDYGRVRVLVDNYGQTVYIEDESGNKEEFTVDPNDERLHLVAIERNPSVGTNSADRSLSFRVDNDVRTIQLDIFPIEESSTAELHIQKLEKGFGGCISELSLAFDYDDFTTGLPIKDNKMEQFEVLKELIERPERPTSVDGLLRYYDECGIRDPTLWESNSEPFGQVGAYDPDHEFDFAWVFHTLFVILNILVVVLGILLCGCCLFCWYRNRKHVYKTSDRGYVSAEEYIKLFKEIGEEDTRSEEDSIPHGIPPLDENPITDRKSPLSMKRVTFKNTPTSIDV